MAMPPAIRIEHLNHSFGRGALKKQILFDITTDIPAGEIVIVTGPSGSGKTTLLTLVGALRSTQDGSVQILGRELRGASSRVLEQVRRRIGFIFQQHNLVEALSAQQNVELGVRCSGRIGRAAMRQRARDMLDAVGLSERMDHKPEQMSGGQRQRVAIARALVGEPDMLLADEPTASLDKQSGREVVDRMQSLAREKGTTILLVTHDNRILDIADRIVHLEDGRLSTFTDAVIASNEHMMKTLAESRQKQPIAEVVADLDESGFRDMLDDITQESQRFLEATALARDMAFQSMLEQALFSFTAKAGQLLDAERASLFLVDRERDSLVLRVAEDLPEDGEVRIPIGSGIAGAVAASGETVRVDDAYADPRFSPDVDRQSGFHTRSILCLPVKDRSGEVFAVAQLLNRRDGQPFEDADAERFAEFLGSLGVILETLQNLGHLATAPQKPGKHPSR
ncbi:ATP-binding cassette domain-containing protein [Wenzhouxiangella sp. XN201]|uniref:ATP-binding cassette domain-containing protein n=1 Tax=Wenzhouxiangella sp. XN201 TaxID=2710755 RepID=UPI0013C56C78|nr:ATP-binding cassette domain-containing protein [Wenzhouxiangella sp. XN201]NEZ02658.1 ATP-binding cassette domain-containing protein [Wenzhouxiangella sp. XN201]